MLKMLRQAYRALNRQAGPLLAIGLAGVAGRNLAQWRRDQILLMTAQSEMSHLPTLQATPKVSVLVAAWNEQDNIAAHIQSFLTLNYPHIELIVGAGGSDATFKIARQFENERIKIVEQHKGEGKQAALARCYQSATGDIIYLTDADCLYDEAALVRLLAPIVNDGAAVATGTSHPLELQLAKTLPSVIWAADTVANWHSPAQVRGLLGRNAAITRAAIEQSGGLDFVAATGTDYQLAQRLLASGLAIQHVKTSSLASDYPADLKTYRHKQTRWLRNLLMYGPRYGAQSDVQNTLKTIATGGLMLVLPLFGTLFGRIWLAVWGVLLGQAVAARLRYLIFTARLHRQPVNPNAVAALVPLTLFDFATWASVPLDLLSSKRRASW